MRSFCAGLTIAALMLVLSGSTFAATETISGRLIDLTCYKQNKANTGVDHKMPEDTPNCAVTRAKMGQPVALLTDDGKVYTVTGELAANNNAKLVPHIVTRSNSPPTLPIRVAP